MKDPIITQKGAPIPGGVPKEPPGVLSKANQSAKTQPQKKVPVVSKILFISIFASLLNPIKSVFPSDAPQITWEGAEDGQVVINFPEPGQPQTPKITKKGSKTTEKVAQSIPISLKRTRRQSALRRFITNVHKNRRRRKFWLNGRNLEQIQPPAPAVFVKVPPATTQPGGPDVTTGLSTQFNALKLRSTINIGTSEIKTAGFNGLETSLFLTDKNNPNRVYTYKVIGNTLTSQDIEDFPASDLISATTMAYAQSLGVTTSDTYYAVLLTPTKVHIAQLSGLAGYSSAGSYDVTGCNVTAFSPGISVQRRLPTPNIYLYCPQTNPSASDYSDVWSYIHRIDVNMNLQKKIMRTMVAFSMTFNNSVVANVTEIKHESLGFLSHYNDQNHQIISFDNTMILSGTAGNLEKSQANQFFSIESELSNNQSAFIYTAGLQRGSRKAFMEIYQFIKGTSELKKIKELQLPGYTLLAQPIEVKEITSLEAFGRSVFLGVKFSSGSDVDHLVLDAQNMTYVVANITSPNGETPSQLIVGRETQMLLSVVGSKAYVYDLCSNSSCLSCGTNNDVCDTCRISGRTSTSSLTYLSGEFCYAADPISLAYCINNFDATRCSDLVSVMRASQNSRSNTDIQNGIIRFTFSFSKGVSIEELLQGNDFSKKFSITIEDASTTRILQTNSFSIQDDATASFVDAGNGDMQMILRFPNSELNNNNRIRIRLIDNFFSAGASLFPVAAFDQTIETGVTAASSLGNTISNVFQSAESAINSTNAVIGGSSGALAIGFGPISLQFLGLALKFFQTMDNLGNFELINIPYGSMINDTFDMVSSINNPPDFSDSQWMDDPDGKLAQHYRRGFREKISQNWDLLFIERSSPSVVVYVACWPIYGLVLLFNNIIFKCFKNCLSAKWEDRLNNFEDFVFGLRTFVIGFLIFDVWPASIYQISVFDPQSAGDRRFRVYMSLLLSYVVLMITIAEVFIMFYTSRRAFIPKEATSSVQIKMPMKKKTVKVTPPKKGPEEPKQPNKMKLAIPANPPPPKLKTIQDIDEEDTNKNKIGGLGLKMMDLKKKGEALSANKSEKNDNNTKAMEVEEPTPEKAETEFSTSEEEFDPKRYLNENEEDFDKLDEVYIVNQKITDQTFQLPKHLQERVEQERLEEERRRNRLIEMFRKQYLKRRRIRKSFKKFKRAVKRIKYFNITKSIIGKKEIKALFTEVIPIFGDSKISKKKVKIFKLMIQKLMMEKYPDTFVEEGEEEDDGYNDDFRPGNGEEDNLVRKTSLDGDIGQNNSTQGGKNNAPSRRGKKPQISYQEMQDRMDEAEQLLKDKIKEESEKDLEVKFVGGPGFLDKKFLELVTGDIIIENLKYTFVKYYNVLFLSRFLAMQVILVVLQFLGGFQAWILFLMQCAWVYFVFKTEEKIGLFENNFLRNYNYVLEISLLIFLFSASIVGFFTIIHSSDWMFPGYAPIGGQLGGHPSFGVEFTAVLSIAAAFLVEAGSMMSMVVAIVVYLITLVYKLAMLIKKRFNMTKEEREKLDEENRKAREERVRKRRKLREMAKGDPEKGVDDVDKVGGEQEDPVVIEKKKKIYRKLADLAEMGKIGKFAKETWKDNIKEQFNKEDKKKPEPPKRQPTGMRKNQMTVGFEMPKRNVGGMGDDGMRKL